jgi:glycosyltransferase involved in cell wall biosynthesis
MNIEFFGSSVIGSNTFQPDKPKSFYDLILEHFNASSLNFMIAQCSEERILYNLKKTSEIDIAIIFHSTPQFIYFPNFTRDFVVMHDHEIDDWNNRQPFLDYVDAFKQNKKDIVHTDTGSYVPIEPVDVSIMKDFMKFHFNKDVNRSRFHGALSLIDDYVYAKKIPAIHVIHDHIPGWFNFKSGVVDTDIWNIEREFSESFNKSVNGISEEGNSLIFNKIISLTQRL